jgi:hypothetical protein
MSSNLMGQMTLSMRKIGGWVKSELSYLRVIIAFETPLLSTHIQAVHWRHRRFLRPQYFDLEWHLCPSNTCCVSRFRCIPRSRNSGNLVVCAWLLVWTRRMGTYVRSLRQTPAHAGGHAWLRHICSRCSRCKRFADHHHMPVLRWAIRILSACCSSCDLCRYVRPPHSWSCYCCVWSGCGGWPTSGTFHRRLHCRFIPRLAL